MKEKAAYLKGLIDGLGIDENTKEGKVIKAMSELLSEMAETVDSIDEDVTHAYDQINDLSEELEDLEADLYEDEDAEDDSDDSDDSDDETEADDDDDNADVAGEPYYEVACPACGKTVYVSEDDLDAGEAICPSCKVAFEVALEDPEDLEQVEGSFFAGFAAVDVEVWISVLSFQFFLGYGAIRCHDFDAVVVPRSKAERFPVEICRHIRRIEVHQMAEHGIQCDRIGGHKKNSHRNRVAGSRTIAFHCYDAVADIEARGDFLVQLDQHVCEALSVRILRVAEFFVDAADAAVLVLDSSGDAFQRVGFHFADADEGVRSQLR